MYGVTKWAPALAYTDNDNVRVSAIPHTQVTVNPIMVLLYKIPMDEEPTETFNKPNTMPDTAFAHSTTGPTNATLIYEIMTDNTSDMAML